MLKGAGIDGTGSPDGAGGDAWLVPGDMLKGVGCARAGWAASGPKASRTGRMDVRQERISRSYFGAVAEAGARVGVGEFDAPSFWSPSM